MTKTSTFGRLLQYLKLYRGMFFLALVMMFFVSGFQNLVPFTTKFLFDDILAQSREINLKMLLLFPALLIGIYLGMAVFGYGSTYLMGSIGQRVILDIREDTYRSIIRQSLSFFDAKSTGELISRITYDIFIIQRAISQNLAIIIRECLVFLGAIGVIFYLNWKLSLFSIAVVPLSMIPLIKFSRKLRNISQKSQERQSVMSSLLKETFSAMPIVMAFGMEKFEIKRFGREVLRLMKVNLRAIRLIALGPPVMELVGAVLTSAIILFYVVFSGEHVTVGDFAAYFTALIIMYNPLRKISRANNDIQQGLAAAGRTFSILDIEPSIKEAPDAYPLPPFSSEIRFEGVSFAYHRQEVLKKIDLTVKNGDIIALVGHSGAGKSTLVNLIPRFYDVNEGKILIDNHDVRKVTLQSLRDQIGIVTQMTILFDDTVRNNIAYGRNDIPLGSVREASRSAYAHDFIEKLPEGYDTVIGETGSRLSGGERQRIAIARAILKDPPILILDEATSSLDSESELLVQNALYNLMKNRTTFIIAHRLSTIKRATRIVVIEDGKIIETGTHEELLSKNGNYTRLYKTQFGR